MSRLQVVIAALVPAVVIAALLIGVVSWRERAAADQARGQEEFAQRQLDEMHRLADTLTTVKADAKQWRERWSEDTSKLGEDLAKANAALADSAKEQAKAQAAVADLAKQLAELAAQLKQLQDAAEAKPPATPDKKK